MSEYYDDLETRDPEQREEQQFALLARQIAHAQRQAPAYGRLLAGVEAAAVTSRAVLAKLPLTRKEELVELQRREPPFGGLAAARVPELNRIFASPGPIYEPGSARPDFWRFARALFAAGFRRGQLLHNCFAYHFTPAGAMVEAGAHALGCAVFAAGPGQLEGQVQTIADLRPDGYVGTPSFLKMILDKGAESGSDVSSLRHALVSGEALPASLRDRFAGRGLQVLQCYATADLGVIAYESPAREGLILDEGVIVEIVRPGSGDPLPDGEVGEVVVTTLAPEYPLLRFATGDLSAILPGPSPCGRTGRRIRGWLGRADQTAKVRGMFVRPGQVAQVLKRHPEVGRGRLIIDRSDDQDVMVLHCEVACTAPEGLVAAIVTSIRELCNLRGEVQLVAPGSLANDGKVIDDRRPVDHAG
ncbi:AMP-binding protein [Desulfuromonas carbonis]|uniref:phenylacetate--CoA ligase family protein n=1 Tax=Desulfuromonas sp. DDH964 TaxID=1823759 RepID=UPI00082DFD14|nr:AMP-binding protein [Desulfuromonas sp. DDH964]